jgi:hypothetical protein
MKKMQILAPGGPNPETFKKRRKRCCSEDKSQPSRVPLSHYNSLCPIRALCTHELWKIEVWDKEDSSMNKPVSLQQVLFLGFLVQQGAIWIWDSSNIRASSAASSSTVWPW